MSPRGSTGPTLLPNSASDRRGGGAANSPFWTCLEAPSSELLVGLAYQVRWEPILAGHPVTPQKAGEREPQTPCTQHEDRGW